MVVEQGFKGGLRCLTDEGPYRAISLVVIDVDEIRNPFHHGGIVVQIFQRNAQLLALLLILPLIHIELAKEGFVSEEITSRKLGEYMIYRACTLRHLLANPVVMSQLLEHEERLGELN